MTDSALPMRQARVCGRWRAEGDGAQAIEQNLKQHVDFLAVAQNLLCARAVRCVSCPPCGAPPHPLREAGPGRLINGRRQAAMSCRSRFSASRSKVSSRAET